MMRCDDFALGQVDTLLIKREEFKFVAIRVLDKGTDHNVVLCR